MRMSYKLTLHVDDQTTSLNSAGADPPERQVKSPSTSCLVCAQLLGIPAGLRLPERIILVCHCFLLVSLPDSSPIPAGDEYLANLLLGLYRM